MIARYPYLKRKRDKGAYKEKNRVRGPSTASENLSSSTQSVSIVPSSYTEYVSLYIVKNRRSYTEYVSLYIMGEKNKKYSEDAGDSIKDQINTSSPLSYNGLIFWQIRNVLGTSIF